MSTPTSSNRPKDEPKSSPDLTKSGATASAHTSTGSADVALDTETKSLSFGDRFRLWWDALARPAQWAIAVPFIIIIGLSPAWAPGFLQTQTYDLGTVLAQFGQYALIAIGLNVVVGQTGLLDLGYVGFFAVGAYTVALVTAPSSPLNLQWSWLAAVPIAIVITSVSGLILGSPTLRLRGDYLAIVTLGFGEIVRLLLQNLRSLTGGGGGMNNLAFPVWFTSSSEQYGKFSIVNYKQPFTAGTWWFWLSMILIAAILMLVGNLERSRVGRAWVAIREDEDAAEIMGVPTFKFKLWAFVIGAAIGGLSGAIYAGQVQSIVPDNFNVVNSMLFLCAVILGGSGNKLGVILGAFVIVYLPARFAALADYRYLIFGVALMILMIFRPQGLVPVRQKLLAAGRKIYQAARRQREQGVSP